MSTITNTQANERVAVSKELRRLNAPTMCHGVKSGHNRRRSQTRVCEATASHFAAVDRTCRRRPTAPSCTYERQIVGRAAGAAAAVARDAWDNSESGDRVAATRQHQPVDRQCVREHSAHTAGGFEDHLIPKQEHVIDTTSTTGVK